MPTSHLTLFSMTPSMNGLLVECRFSHPGMAKQQISQTRIYVKCESFYKSPTLQRFCFAFLLFRFIALEMYSSHISINCGIVLNFFTFLMFKTDIFLSLTVGPDAGQLALLQKPIFAVPEGDLIYECYVPEASPKANVSWILPEELQSFSFFNETVSLSRLRLPGDFYLISFPFPVNRCVKGRCSGKQSPVSCTSAMRKFLGTRKTSAVWRIMTTARRFGNLCR